ncbi:MAG: protein methyltransferase [Gammaproteobacteria bacterium]|jgi:predicted nicotinamide N-methyase|nr:protein methyltransferase [Gammaproteobacteria bacterium]
MSERNPPASSPPTPPAALERHLAALIPGATLVPTPLPLAPSLRLWLLGPTVPAGPLAPEAAAQLQDTPPYWAFCWASGHALAAEILEGRVAVEGRRVIDFGAGSGVAALAAALSGASEVYAVDEDPRALAAMEANAALNSVTTLRPVLSLEALPPPENEDLLLLADVLYDPANRPLVDGLQATGRELLIADARVAPEKLPAWECLWSREAATLPDLDESPLFRTVRFYRAARPT